MDLLTLINSCSTLAIVLRNFAHLLHSVLSVIRVAGVTISIVLEWKQSRLTSQRW